jgi:peptidoglycan/xylan/chitin deacetylase (PgdA/CDA1 family)
MMRIPGRKLARRWLRPLRRQFFPGAVVLGYHRVAEASWDPLGLAVSPERFRAQVEILKGLRELLSLGELAARHAAGERLERYAVLTFDDGYRDFAETVVPIAEKLDVPATVFVTTGCTGRSFWWEEIAALLAPQLAAADTLEIVYPAGDPRTFKGLDQAEARAATVRQICGRLACSGAAEIHAVLEQLRAWAGPAGEAARPDGAPMNESELKSLARHARAEIGAHTVSHVCLARLEPEAQRDEIGRSKAALESLTGNAVTVFSYPNGSLSEATPALVESLGFQCACTSLDGSWTHRGDRYRIPRNWAPDAGPEAFRRWLGQWVSPAR